MGAQVFKKYLLDDKNISKTGNELIHGKASNMEKLMYQTYLQMRYKYKKIVNM